VEGVAEARWFTVLRSRLNMPFAAGDLTSSITDTKHLTTLPVNYKKRQKKKKHKKKKKGWWLLDISVHNFFQYCFYAGFEHRHREVEQRRSLWHIFNSCLH
jgi:hypothetical protein